MRPRIFRRVTVDQVEDGKTYIVTDTSTGKFATVKAEVRGEWTEVHPRSVVLAKQDGDLDVGPIYDWFTIEEV